MQSLEGQLRERQAEVTGGEALAADLRRKLARAAKETERLAAEADAGREVASERTLAGRVRLHCFLLCCSDEGRKLRRW